MPHCEYCSATFEDEDAYLEHLRTEHEGELTRIDQRRVAALDADNDGPPLGPLIVAALVVGGLILVLTVAVIATDDGDADSEPTVTGAVHEHGTMEIVIDGEELSLDSPEFIRDSQHAAFHFHAGYEEYDNYIWHVHAEGVTIQYALDTLDIQVDDDGTQLSYDGETYRDSDPGTEIRIEVNGEPVAPGEHVLDGVADEAAADAGEGDDVRVVVETAR